MLPIELAGKVAIVTGASQGIGLGVSSVLARAGCDIAGCGLSHPDDPKVNKFESSIQEYSRKAFYKSIDITSEHEINSFIKDVIAHYGRIDILVSNAGKNMFTSPDKCEADFWNENVALNLKSHWLISKACHAQLIKNKGSIIIMSSNHAYSTMPDCFPYNVSKAGLSGLVQSLAVQWGPEIRIIGLAPGFIETDGGNKWFETFDDPAAKREEIKNIHPLKRFGTIEEIGAFCAFLCSSYSSFASGTTYLIDGGRSALMQDR
jgi:NAD(P)-dependent dehydrogenase (short-subunit alcohol dehydrogenase family)